MSWESCVSFNAPILLVIVLLVVAASLASYLVSQWSAISGGRGVVASIALTAGATALLIAAAMVLLTLYSPSLLRFHDDGGANARSTGAGRASGLLAQSPSAHVSQSGISDVLATQAGGRRSVSALTQPHAPRSPSQTATLTAVTPSTSRAGANRMHTDTYLPRGALTTAGPWAATTCVHALRRDPDNPTRWTIENECGTPVGIVFAACDEAPTQCDAPRAGFWTYDVGGMFLPSQAQRSVTDDEETRYGRQIRYVACSVTNAAAVALLGEDSAEQSTPARLERFDAAVENDECVQQVRYWSDAGRSAAISIDALLGPGLPGRTRRADD